MTTASFPRSPPTGVSSPSRLWPRTWSGATRTIAPTSSSTTESGARRPGSASAPPGRRQMTAAVVARDLRQRALRRLLLRVPRTWSRTTTTASADFFVRDLKRARRRGSASAPPGRSRFPARRRRAGDRPRALPQRALRRLLLRFHEPGRRRPKRHRRHLRPRPKAGRDDPGQRQLHRRGGQWQQPLLSLDLGQRALRRLHVLRLEPGRGRRKVHAEDVFVRDRKRA